MRLQGTTMSICLFLWGLVNVAAHSRGNHVYATGSRHVKSGPASMAIHEGLHPLCAREHSSLLDCASACIKQPHLCHRHILISNCSQGTLPIDLGNCSPFVYQRFKSAYDALGLAHVSNTKSGSCVAPRNSNSPKSILWPGLRPIWHDVGFDSCKTPSGLDAGLCVNTKGSVHCLPSFLIIGVQKAATRELSNWLDCHSQLEFAGAELHMLQTISCTEWQNIDSVHSSQPNHHTVICGHSVGPSRRTRPRLRGNFWRSYQEYFPSDHRTRSNRANPPQNMYFFEKTPRYIGMSEDNIKEVFRLFPSMKLILQLRNPVDRLYSWFYMYCGAPNSTSSIFVEAIRGKFKSRVFNGRGSGIAEDYQHITCTPQSFERLVSIPMNSAFPASCSDMESCGWRSSKLRIASSTPGDFHSVGDALSRGHYAEHIERWLRWFPHNQLHIVHNHLMFANGIKQMKRLETFLGISADDWSNKFSVTSKGTATLNNDAVHGKVSKLERHAPPLPMLKSTRELLIRYYSSHNKALQKLLRKIECGAPGDASYAENCDGIDTNYPTE